MTHAQRPGLLNVKRLISFLHVARAGSFGQAATALDIAQPALTRQVQLLERDLGVVLLERTPRGVALTQVGRVLYEHAGEIIKLVNNAEQAVLSTRNSPTGTVHLGVLHTFAEQFTPALIQRVSTNFSQIKLKVTEAPTEILCRSLMTGDIDLAVIVASPDLRKLIQEALLTDRLHLVGAAGNAETGARHVDVARLQHLPIALAFSRHSPRDLVREAAKRAGFKITPVHEIDSLHLMKETIKTLNVFSILPRLSCAREIADGTLAASPLRPQIPITYVLATLRGNVLSLAARTVAREIPRIVKANS